MMIQDEITGLIQRKYSEFSNFRTAIRDFTVLLVNGVPRVKVRPGDTFPVIPQLPTPNEHRLHAGSASGVTSESILSLRKSLKLSQIKFGELVGGRLEKYRHRNMVRRYQRQSRKIKFVI